MKNFILSEMIKGWFVGDFEKSALRSSQFEVAIKKYKKGDFEVRHVHKVAKEITVILGGKVKMNDSCFSDGDIVVIDPGESTDFFVLEDCTTVVVKTPSSIGDKYLCE